MHKKNWAHLTLIAGTDVMYDHEYEEPLGCREFDPDPDTPSDNYLWDLPELIPISDSYYGTCFESDGDHGLHCPYYESMVAEMGEVDGDGGMRVVQIERAEDESGHMLFGADSGK
ncbi:hypothetical protein A0H81_02295 [Grifola frondosa]|uniref:Uncharacterized protein n=1 Tax=Grifola frondosa TaxID=5627 RepID=A0A1C7MLS6_GRIFR|nr:hypothetical protein A0H81_02295 [Grifola frondosa]